MSKSKSSPGLSNEQIDAITIEICYAEALAAAINQTMPAEQDPSFIHLLRRQLSKVKDMVLESHIGGNNV